MTRASQRRAEDNVRAAQSQLQQAASNLNQAQAQVQVDQESLGFTQVTAPIAGFMGDILFKVGDYISTGQPVTTITENRGTVSAHTGAHHPVNSTPHRATGGVG